MRPDSEAALAEMIRSADGPLAIRGGGTRGFSTGGTVLETGGLSGVSLYEPGALTLVAGAGTPLSEIEAVLAAENQRLAFEPMDHRGVMGTTGEPTLGGVMAANVSGPRRIQGGAARDYALGVRFVDGAGTIVSNGGRVMKNVTGYDLVKLMCGAYGTLGVLTEVSLKVLPVPETSGTLMLRDLTAQDAVEVMSRALGSPWEITGASHCAKIIDDRPVTALRVEGFEDSVNYRLQQLKTLFADRGVDMEIAPQDMSDWFWDGVRNAGKFSEAEGDVWRVSCKPSDGPGLDAAAGAEECFTDWGGGLIWFRMAPGTDLRARLGSFDGHATLVRASEETRATPGVFQPEAPGVARLSAGLRARFDPRGILNRGLMGPVMAGEPA
ncbi:FAD-binding protein [uncultured Roseobacter sp.]|uniref:FAD-binding protein n=1 Tax=uncultured Roseobacter sp. TaxID=114847 RepID=UPI002605613C|nr:FAD-binding protein [uncultured Roseobacter sp.]